MEPIERARAEDNALNSIDATADAIAEAERKGDPRAADYYRDRNQEAWADLRALVFSDMPSA
jgi:hypothetical protein